MVPHSDCFCDECFLRYFMEGLIPKGTPAYEEASRLAKGVSLPVVLTPHEPDCPKELYPVGKWLGTPDP